MRKLGLGTLLAVAAHAQGHMPAQAQAPAHVGEVRLAEQAGHVTEGRVVIDATPREIYDVVTAYRSWPTYLSDVRSVTVESGGREDARVEFYSRTLGRRFTLEFDNEPGHAISFRGIEGPPGGRASGHYALIPIDGGKRTLVIARLYMDIVGAPALFVRDSTIRAMRREKLAADLKDIAAYFERRGSR